MAVPVNYNEETDEIVVGFVPNRDGSDYDEDMESPSFDELLDALEDHYVNGDMVLKVIGKMYRGRTKISGITVFTDFNSVYTVANGKGNYREKIKNMFNSVQDVQHVTAFVVQAS